MLTVRETIATLLTANADLLDLGLPEDAVYQADTVDSPTEKQFLVLRWGTEQPGMGAVTRRPLTIWSYGEFGDPTTTERIAVAAGKYLSSLFDIATYDGRIGQIQDGFRGPDLQDDGWKRLVIPYNVTVNASGV